MPGSFRYKTNGLCGTFDGNVETDFTTIEGIVENSPNSFGNFWKADQACGDISATINPRPCELYPHKVKQAEQHCKELLEGAFAGTAVELLNGQKATHR